MSRVAFAYIVQLNLPGYPVKIGSTSQPRKRFKTFDVGTPAECRIIGITLDGVSREREMLSATSSTVIKGEWRYPTRELQVLLCRYFSAGEWFVEADDHEGHLIATKVADRVAPFNRGNYPVNSNSIGYHWAKDVLKLAEASDPLLGIDWSGYMAALHVPTLRWPTAERSAA